MVEYRYTFFFIGDEYYDAYIQDEAGFKSNELWKEKEKKKERKKMSLTCLFIEELLSRY